MVSSTALNRIGIPRKRMDHAENLIANIVTYQTSDKKVSER